MSPQATAQAYHDRFFATEQPGEPDIITDVILGEAGRKEAASRTR